MQIKRIGVIRKSDGKLFKAEIALTDSVFRLKEGGRIQAGTVIVELAREKIERFGLVSRSHVDLEIYPPHCRDRFDDTYIVAIGEGLPCIPSKSTS